VVVGDVVGSVWMKTGYGSLSKGSVTVITRWVFLLMMGLVGVCSCWWKIMLLV